MGAQNQRPRFYEGQYLSADDLATVVEYLRTADGRHALAAHTWGIALGLTLTERGAAGAADRVDVMLQPGFAWDGYGRPIVNTRPVRLREELFAEIPYHPTLDDVAAGGQGRLVPVWLTYDETASRNPAPGFETCATDSQHSRIGESFHFEIGKRNASERRGRVTIGTLSVDPAEALARFDTAAGPLWDASVPHQEFPAGGKPPRWLIPIGFVRWVARDQELGYFAARDLNAADRADDQIRAFRQYAGAVAEYIQAADGAIVMHRRDERPELAHRFRNLMTQPGADTAALLQDLLWIEGHLRVIGDAKLAGGELHFRNDDSLDEGTPLYLSRAGDARVDGLPGMRELRVVIGPDDQTEEDEDGGIAGPNRLVVGATDGATPPAIAPTLVAVSNGRVGVGTRDPATSLEVVGDWNGGEGAIRVTGDQPAIRYEGGEPSGEATWVTHVTDDPEGNFRVAYQDDTDAWHDVLHATRDTRVGVGGSTAPTHPLGIRGAGDTENLVSFEDSSGAGKWEINHKPNGTTGLNFAQSGVTDTTLFLADGGKVGVNTLTPQGILTVTSSNPFQGSLHAFTATADVEYDGGSDDLFVFRDSSNGTTSFLQTRLGVGTTAPASPLGVRATGTTEALVSFERPAGGTEWHINQAPAGARGLNIVETDAGASRLFVREGGNVGIGTTTPRDRLDVNGHRILVEGAGGEQAYIGGDGTGDVEVGTANSGVNHLTLWNRASSSRLHLHCFDLHTSSDLRLKKNVATISSALATVGRLRGVQFKWKGDSTPAMGVVAQEIRKVLPHLVTESRDGLSVSYTGLVPVLIEAVKELTAQVETLQRDVAKLKTAQKTARAKR